mmetsp:Transcript_40512/g.96272  ORF Transcript_40512/g.96272 Transcript_40512/m.96272 type:complete len:234 (+) Transcript_40512:404-1105(+)
MGCSQPGRQSQSSKGDQREAAQPDLAAGDTPPHHVAGLNCPRGHRCPLRRRACSRARAPRPYAGGLRGERKHRDRAPHGHRGGGRLPPPLEAAAGGFGGRSQRRRGHGDGGGGPGRAPGRLLRGLGPQVPLRVAEARHRGRRQAAALPARRPRRTARASCRAPQVARGRGGGGRRRRCGRPRGADGSDHGRPQGRRAGGQDGDVRACEPPGRDPRASRRTRGPGSRPGRMRSC